MIEKLSHYDGLGWRPELLENVALSEWINQSGLQVLQPLGQYLVLWVLLLGLAAHYLPSRLSVNLAGGLVPRIPGVVLGVGLAAILGGLSLLLVGPRANIYFAF